MMLVLFLLFPLCLGYKTFQDKIPNGDKVPHPCFQGEIWQGVGHKTALGGGGRNAFGLDFNANGQVWDKTLCEKDSDGDGRTNGVELGDPDCVWIPGNSPRQNGTLTHPGVCEPRDSSACRDKNQWRVCSPITFQCDRLGKIENRPLSFILENTQVPPKKTTHMCQVFTLPDDKDYHMIAVEPILDNMNVIHHLQAFLCDETAGDSAYATYINPGECDMVPAGCRSWLADWNLGELGICYGEDYGFEFGKTSKINFLLLQVHWNNHEMRGDYYDHSGFKFYYTTHPPTYRAGMLTVGQLMVDIPPDKDSYQVTGGCSSSCSRKTLGGEVTLVSVTLHMHYMGKSAELTLVRASGGEQRVALDDEYNYDSPKRHRIENLKVSPGDSFKLTCKYASKTKTTRTLYGDSSSDEMCFAYLIYYPFDTQYSMCVSSNNLGVCNKEWDEPNDCNMESLNDKIQTNEQMSNLILNCDPSGEKCESKCENEVRKFKVSDPCFRGDALYYTEFLMEGSPTFRDSASKFRRAIRSCDPDPTSSTNQITASYISLILVIFLFGI